MVLSMLAPRIGLELILGDEIQKSIGHLLCVELEGDVVLREKRFEDFEHGAAVRD